jgi:integrase
LKLAAEEWEVIPAVPRVKLAKEPQGRLRWLTEDEASRLLDACAGCPTLQNLVTLCLFTGLRQAEATELTWDRVDRSRGVVLLEVTKSGRRREVPLNVEADAALVGQGPTTDGLVFQRDFPSLRRTWERSLITAKISAFRFHDLRHTFASWSVQRGTTLQELKDLLGHSSLQMVMRTPTWPRSIFAPRSGGLKASCQHIINTTPLKCLILLSRRQSSTLWADPLRAF